MASKHEPHAHSFKNLEAKELEARVAILEKEVAELRSATSDTTLDLTALHES